MAGQTQLTVIGAGAWGTVFAELAARAGSRVRVLTRNQKVARAITFRHRNPRLAPKLDISRNVRAGTDPDKMLRDADIVVVAVASQAAAGVLAPLADYVPDGAVAVSLMKGIELGTGRRMSQVVAQSLGLAADRVAVVSGPNLSPEIVRGDPAAAVLACTDLAVAERVAAAVTTPLFHAEVSQDVIGVELAGATKNVIAFAVGLADGLGYGLSTQATLISRGLVETIRFGLALGGRVETFVGPAGVGDLTATCMSTLSRNRTLGFHMGKGLGLEEAIAATGGTAESVKSCAAIAQLAASAGVEMPITDAVTAVLHRGAAPKDMVAEAVCRSSRLLEQLERAEHGEIDSSELGALGL